MLSTPTVPATLTTDADFRAWASAIHNGIIAAGGLVNTADTGQVDLTTVAKPATAGVQAGYKVYRFDDAAQATAPVFIKVFYGTGDVATEGGLWPQVGFGSNGAGTLTGTAVTNTFRIYASADPPMPVRAHISVATDHVAVLGYYDPITPGSPVSRSFGFLVERVRDATGAPTDHVFLLVYGSGFATHRFLHRTSGTNTSGTSNNTVPVLVPVTSGSNSDTTAVSDGGDFGVFPIYPVHGWPRGAIVNALLYLDADIAIHTQVVLSVHGTARTYRALGTALAQTPSGSINTNLRMLLRAD